MTTHIGQAIAGRAIVALVLAAGVLSGCTSDPPSLDHLVIAGGPAGDVYDAFATGIAGAARDLGSVDARVLRTAGAKENLQLVADGRADAGLTTVDVAEQALEGDAPFARAQPLTAVASLYDDYLHLVARSDSPIRTLSDLRGHRLGTAGSGSTAKTLTDRLLATIPVFGVIEESIAPDKLGDALIDRRVDAIALTGGLPAPAVDELVRRVSVRLIPVAAERAMVAQRFPDQYLERSLPAGMYGLAGEVETVGVRTVLVVRRDLPDRAAYAITQLLFAAKLRLVPAYGQARWLDPGAALETYPLPLHPGAARYYRDTKPLS